MVEILKMMIMMVMTWDSDQEEEALWAKAQAQKQGSNLSKYDQLVLKRVLSSELPDRVLTIFGSLFMALVNSGKTGESIHSKVVEDLTANAVSASEISHATHKIIGNVRRSTWQLCGMISGNVFKLHRTPQ